MEVILEDEIRFGSKLFDNGSVQTGRNDFLSIEKGMLILGSPDFEFALIGNIDLTLDTNEVSMTFIHPLFKLSTRGLVMVRRTVDESGLVMSDFLCMYAQMKFNPLNMLQFDSGMIKI